MLMGSVGRCLLALQRLEDQAAQLPEVGLQVVDAAIRVGSWLAPLFGWPRASARWPARAARRPRGEVVRRCRDRNPAARRRRALQIRGVVPAPGREGRGATAGDAPQEDLRGYRPDFYLPDDPEAPVTAAGAVWLEHYAHDRSGRAPFAGYEEERAWKRRLHESLSTRCVETSFGDLQRAWDGDGPGMAEVLVERLRASR